MMIFCPNVELMAFAAGSTTNGRANFKTTGNKFKEWTDMKVEVIVLVQAKRHV